MCINHIVKKVSILALKNSVKILYHNEHECIYCHLETFLSSETFFSLCNIIVSKILVKTGT